MTLSTITSSVCSSPVVAVRAGAVVDFMLAADQTVTNLNMKQLALYVSLCKEECTELIIAHNKLSAASGITHANFVELLDGIGDLMWVAFGAALSAGVQPAQILERIATSNMSKVVNGKLQKNPVTGKVQKPDTFVEPVLEDIVEDVLVTRPQLRSAVRSYK